jgi:predicted outer membrane repeat protein
LEGLESRQLLSAFTVVLATDSGGTGGQMVTATTGDLRYCIAQADAAPAAASDVINFDPTVFATPQTITLDAGKGTLVLSDANPLTLQGPSGGLVTVSGGDAVTILNISSGTVTINNLEFSHGHTTGLGGGIVNGGTLGMMNCGFDHDSAAGGGGLYNAAGSATLTGCIFNHDAAQDGGGIYASGILTLKNCNLSNDVSTGVGGGALWVNIGCTATVTGCTLSDDTTAEDGGGVFVYKSSTATFSNCTLSNDSAANGGGALCTDGVCTVKMTKCTIANDTSAQGGGVCNSGGKVTLTQCTLSNDACAADGGGGGFLNEGTGTAAACTFNNDSAAAGGGMFNRGPATLTNCTFASNTAVTGGGGIYSTSLSGQTFVLKVTNCTVADNVVVRGSGGGIYNDSATTLKLANTIVAENTASAFGPDYFGNISTADHNLIGDGTGATIVIDQGGNLVGGNGNPVIDARLGPLANNGGPTQTMALLADSPAIGHARDAVAPANDQRGHKRTDHFGLATDIGAFEYP